VGSVITTHIFSLHIFTVCHCTLYCHHLHQNGRLYLFFAPNCWMFQLLKPHLFPLFIHINIQPTTLPRPPLNVEINIWLMVIYSCMNVYAVRRNYGCDTQFNVEICTVQLLYIVYYMVSINMSVKIRCIFINKD
jgi:hypothetical protein